MAEEACVGEAAEAALSEGKSAAAAAIHDDCVFYFGYDDSSPGGADDVRVTPDGKYLIVLSNSHGRVWVLDAATGHTRHVLGDGSPTPEYSSSPLAVTPGGEAVLLSTGLTTCAWDVATGDRLCRVTSSQEDPAPANVASVAGLIPAGEEEPEVSWIAAHPDGERFLVVVAVWGLLELWHMRSGRLLSRVLTQDPDYASVPARPEVVVCQYTPYEVLSDWRLSLWRAAQPGGDSTPPAASYYSRRDEQSDVVLVNTAEWVHWYSTSGDALALLEGRSLHIIDLAENPLCASTGGYLGVVDVPPDADDIYSRARLFNTDTGTYHRLGRGSELTLSPDGSYVALVASGPNPHVDDGLLVWKRRAGGVDKLDKLHWCRRPQPVRGNDRGIPYVLAFSPGNRFLAVGYNKSVVRVRDVATGEVLLSTGLAVPRALVDVRPRLATRDSQQLWLPVSAAATGIAFSPDGSVMYVTCGARRKVGVWRVDAWPDHAGHAGTRVDVHDGIDGGASVPGSGSAGRQSGPKHHDKAGVDSLAAMRLPGAVRRSVGTRVSVLLRRPVTRASASYVHPRLAYRWSSDP